MGLANQEIGIGATVKARCILRAIISAQATFEPVIAGEFADGENIGVVEDEALGVFIDQGPIGHFIGAHNDLANRLDNMRHARAAGHHRQTILHAKANQGAATESIGTIAKECCLVGIAAEQG